VKYGKWRRTLSNGFEERLTKKAGARAFGPGGIAPLLSGPPRDYCPGRGAHQCTVSLCWALPTRNGLTAQLSGIKIKFLCSGCRSCVMTTAISRRPFGRWGIFGLWPPDQSVTRVLIRGGGRGGFAVLSHTGASLTLPYLVSIAVGPLYHQGSLDLAGPTLRAGRPCTPPLPTCLSGFLANFFQVTILEWTGQHVMHRMRQDLFVHLMGLEPCLFYRYPIGRLVTRLTTTSRTCHENCLLGDRTLFMT